MWTDDHVPTPPVSLDATHTNYATCICAASVKPRGFLVKFSGRFRGTRFISLWDCSFWP